MQIARTPVSEIIKEAELWQTVHKSFMNLLLMEMPEEKQKEIKDVFAKLKENDRPKT